MLAIFVVAAAGMARLLRDQPRSVAAVAGLLYAFHPFMLTRVAVGHFNSRREASNPGDFSLSVPTVLLSHARYSFVPQPPNFC